MRLDACRLTSESRISACPRNRPDSCRSRSSQAGTSTSSARRRTEVGDRLFAREVVGGIVVGDLQRPLRLQLHQPLGRLFVAAVGLAPGDGAQRRSRRRRAAAAPGGRRSPTRSRSRSSGSRASSRACSRRPARRRRGCASAARRLHERAVAGHHRRLVAVVDLVADEVRRRLPLRRQIVHPALKLFLQRREPGRLGRPPTRLRHRPGRPWAAPPPRRAQPRSPTPPAATASRPHTRRRRRRQARAPSWWRNR